MHDADVIDVLTAQINELAQTCARLSEENAELRGSVAALSAGQRIASASPPAVERGPAGEPNEPARPRKLTERRISRRSIGVALAGLAAGVVGSTVLTDRTHRSPATPAPVAAGEGARAELTALEATAPTAPVSAGSMVSGTRATTSGVLNGTNTSTGAGVAGTNTGAGAGVQGVNLGSGPAVVGASKRGRGGVFSGRAAQIRLVPGGDSHPASGERGDLYADGQGRLWFCKAGGRFATWRRIA